MLAALAWVCGDAVLLVRTGNQRYAVTGLLVYVGGLLFFEKAAVIPFVAFAIAALLAYVTGTGSPMVVWRRGIRLWVSSLAVTAAWIAVYLTVVDQKRWSLDWSMTWDLLARSVTHGDRARSRRRTLGLAALGARLAVGHTAADRHDCGLGGTGGGAGGDAHPQAAHRCGLGGGARLRGGLPDTDLPDAVVAVHRTRVGADPAVPPRSRRRTGTSGGRRLMRAQPRRRGLAGQLARQNDRDRHRDNRIRGEQPVLDDDVPDELARQPGPAVPAECHGRTGQRLHCSPAQ